MIDYKPLELSSFQISKSYSEEETLKNLGTPIYYLCDMENSIYEGDIFKEINRAIDPKIAKELEIKFRKILKLDPVKYSMEYMSEALRLYLAYGHTSASIYNLTLDIFQEKFKFYPEFLKLFKDANETNSEFIFCTANHYASAKAILDILRSELRKMGGIPNHKEKLISSVINWNSKRVDYINVAENKANAVKEMGINLDNVSMIIGDDPYVNDIELFKLKPEASRLIKTENNAGFYNGWLAPSTWGQICAL